MTTRGTERDPEVPEADALEQAQPTGDDADDWYDERS